MEYTEAVTNGAQRGRLVEVEAKGEQEEKQKKAVVKGARLHLYPPGFNLYRSSRGVKRPKVRTMSEFEVQKLIGTAPLTYEKTISITGEDGEVKNIINYRQYNRQRGTEEEPSGNGS